jgi:hypothetical protein
MTTTSFVPNRSTTAGELARLHIEGEMMSVRYVQGMQHRCKHIDYNDTSLRIEGRLDQHWWMFDPNDRDVEDEVINFCPFCGEKLPEITA